MEEPGRSDVPLEEASLGAVPTFYPHRLAPLLHAVDCCGAELGTESGEGPAAGIEHSYPTLPVHYNDHVGPAAIAGHGDVQDVFGPLQKGSHEEAYRPGLSILERRAGLPSPSPVDIGRLSPAFPVTPPDMRVRIRRFGGLSYRQTVNLGIPSESK